MAKKNTSYPDVKNYVGFLKRVKRRAKQKKKRKGWFKYYFAVVRTAKSKGKTLTKGELPVFRKYTPVEPPKALKPKLSETILFLANNKNTFSRDVVKTPKDGVFIVPEIFSLTETYEESFLFLKRLFYALYTERCKKIYIDYQLCRRIDIDASVCMDVIVKEFLLFYRDCKKRKYPVKIDLIRPINFEKDEVLKILTSIGAFNTISGVKMNYPDIIPFYLIIGENRSNTIARDKELEVTKIVDYIVESLARMNRTLTWKAEDDLSKVVGEILINAAEHSGGLHRYSIGYFQETKNVEEHVGVFNLTIFAFGHTIYENFKKPLSKDLEVVARMKELSGKYTQKKLFQNRKFEEETLWTLYALQDGVTSVKDKKRGNGSIHYIESFFNLKGNMENDHASNLTLISGNTRIKFDGTYKIVERPRGKEGKLYKMMTFNNSGNIEDKPDDNFVTFADNFFPGTVITAKIYINFNNIEKEVIHDKL